MRILTIIVVVTLTALFGMLLGGAFGWLAGMLVPGIFVPDDVMWNSSHKLYAVMVFGAAWGVLCGGCLGAFAVAIQAIVEFRRSG